MVNELENEYGHNLLAALKLAVSSTSDPTDDPTVVVIMLDNMMIFGCQRSYNEQFQKLIRSAQYVPKCVQRKIHSKFK